jgi:ubiquinone/menaquinone biosynthesis C-methylase UbiE
MQLHWATLGAVPRRASTAELMDDPSVDEAELADNFREIEETNRRFGGIAPVLREVFARRGERLLDVACGSADIPRALLREARRRGRRLEVVALDRSTAALTIARRLAGDEPFLRFVRADGTELPFPDASFDFVTCNLALHHFDPPAALALLRELRRVARVAPLVCDLRRSYAGYIAARLYARFFC